MIVRRLFTKKPSIIDRLRNAHPAVQTLALIAALSMATYLAELACTLLGAPSKL